MRIGGEHLRSICFTLPGTWQTGGTWEISGAFPSSVGGVRAAPSESSEKCLDGGANRPHLKGRFIPWECQDVWPWATSVPSHGKSVLRVFRGAKQKRPLRDGWFVELQSKIKTGQWLQDSGLTESSQDLRRRDVRAGICPALH